eukprot:gene28751-3525_t
MQAAYFEQQCGYQTPHGHFARYLKEQGRRLHQGLQAEPYVADESERRKALFRQAPSVQGMQQLQAMGRSSSQQPAQQEARRAR